MYEFDLRYLKYMDKQSFTNDGNNFSRYIYNSIVYLPSPLYQKGTCVKYLATKKQIKRVLRQVPVLIVI